VSRRALLVVVGLAVVVVVGLAALYTLGGLGNAVVP
jgi:hypothetical protein